jgi:hypothetical protein
MTPTIAIDPGSASSAAVAMIDSTGNLSVSWGFDNLRGVASAVASEVKKYGPLAQLRFVVEFVHAMPGQGVTSMFTFGRGTGVGFGALFALRPDCPVYEVPPQTWQKWYRLNDFDCFDASWKFDSTMIAPKIFSEEQLQQCRQPRGKLNHNACDAALIAYWAANQEPVMLKVSEHFRTPEAPPKRRKPSKAGPRGTASEP